MVGDPIHNLWQLLELDNLACNSPLSSLSSPLHSHLMRVQFDRWLVHQISSCMERESNVRTKYCMLRDRTMYNGDYSGDRVGYLTSKMELIVTISILQSSTNSSLISMKTTSPLKGILPSSSLPFLPSFFSPWIACISVSSLNALYHIRTRGWHQFNL